MVAPSRPGVQAKSATAVDVYQITQDLMVTQDITCTVNLQNSAALPAST